MRAVKIYTVLMVMVVLAFVLKAGTEATSVSWDAYYQTKASLKTCTTVESIISVSEAIKTQALGLNRRELYEWAINNEAFYLIQLFKKNTDYSNTMAILDSGYGENLEKVKSIIEPNRDIITEILIILPDGLLLQNEGPRAMAKSNREFAKCILENILDKEVPVK